MSDTKVAARAETLREHIRQRREEGALDIAGI